MIERNCNEIYLKWLYLDSRIPGDSDIIFLLLYVSKVFSFICVSIFFNQTFLSVSVVSTRCFKIFQVTYHWWFLFSYSLTLNFVFFRCCYWLITSQLLHLSCCINFDRDLSHAFDFNILLLELSHHLDIIVDNQHALGAVLY